MIVKVQIAIAGNAPKPMALIYNKGRSIMYETEASSEILKLMAGEVKKYFNASPVGDGKVKLESEANTQPW
jgi:hypothetical protein